MTILDTLRTQVGTFSAVRFDKKTLNMVDSMRSFIKNPVPRDKIHCTIVMSKEKEMPNYPTIKHMDIKATIEKYEVWEMEDGRNCLVGIFKSDELSERFQSISDMYDIEDKYNGYIPHITLSYDVSKNMKVDHLTNFLSEVRIIGEYTAALH